LIHDLRTALSKAGFAGFSSEKHAARIVIRGITDPLNAARCCAKVFGVASAAPGVLVPSTIEHVTRSIVQLAEESLRPGQSFAIRARRSAPSPLSRCQIETHGGSEVLKALNGRSIKVNLKEPDTTIFVDIAGDRAYVYAIRFPGPSGLPLSSQWRLLAVLDSGPLTILASYAMMRRGCLAELLIPLSDIFAPFARDYQLSLARRLRLMVTRANCRAYTLDVDGLIQEKIERLSLGYGEIRQLVRVAGAKFAEQKKYKGLVSSQVSGQSLDFPSVRGAASVDLPIFHPLIGLDIEDLAEMCGLLGIPEKELLSQLNRELSGNKTKVPLTSIDLSEMKTERVLL